MISISSVRTTTGIYPTRLKLRQYMYIYIYIYKKQDSFWHRKYRSPGPHGLKKTEYAVCYGYPTLSHTARHIIINGNLQESHDILGSPGKRPHGLDMSKGSWDPLGASWVPKPPMGSPVLAISSMWINIVKRFIEIASNLESDMDTVPSKKTHST